MFKEMKMRQLQKRANAFVNSLEGKSDKEVEQAYLDNKEFTNNEIVLSFLFFKHPSLIRILPLDFQKSRINSNLSMFRSGSNEARKSLVSDWIKDNKFFMNATSIGMDDEEYNNYLKIYFNQKEDIVKLYMDDLRRVVEILYREDARETEKMISEEASKFTTRQWDFIVKAEPSLIKYAPSDVQDKYSLDEKYIKYISGDAKHKYIDEQIKKIKDNNELLNEAPIDIKCEYINRYPFMINYISSSSLIELLKYDINFIRYINITSFKREEDKSIEIIYEILSNIENKSVKDIVDIMIDKGLFNAKGKVFRYDPKSNDVTYQYTKRLIRILQNLSIEQIIPLIQIDSNYVLPYVVPVYNDNTDLRDKEKIVVDADFRCLNLLKAYYGEEIYNKYYKVVNKIYNDFLANLNSYDYTKDHDSIFDLFKILFNKNIILNNSFDKISVYIGMSIFYKGKETDRTRKVTTKVLNELLTNAYKRNINISKSLYDISSLEIFDERLSFIPYNLLSDFNDYNFTNFSTLLYIAKNETNVRLFKYYLDIVFSIYGENKESLYRAIENFTYYKEIIRDIIDKDLNDEETKNLIDLIATFGNFNNITKKSELSSYDLTTIKNFVSELSMLKDTDTSIYSNLLSNYLFGKAYDIQGNHGYLEISTIKQLINIFDIESLENFEIDGSKVFNKEEIDFYTLLIVMFKNISLDIVFEYVNNLMNDNYKRNIMFSINFFNKIKKYKRNIINDNIVTINDIIELYNESPDVVKYENKNGVDIYTVVGQDFKVLCSANDDGINYRYVNVSSLGLNSYGYGKLVNDYSVRFSEDKDGYIIKVNKDNKEKINMKAESIIVVGKLTDDLINIAKTNNLKIIYVEGRW